MEAIAVGISDQNVASVGDVNSVGEARDLLASNATLELARLAEDGNAMTFKVANVKVVA